MESLFLTVAEAAELLGIPESTLYHWQWCGSFPEGFPAPTKIGRRVAYPRLRLIAWAEGQIAASSGGGRDA